MYPLPRAGCRRKSTMCRLPPAVGSGRVVLLLPLYTGDAERSKTTCVSIHQLQLISPRRECGGENKVSTKTGTLLIPLRVTSHTTSCRVNLHHLATRKHSRGKCWADSSQHGIVYQGHRRESVIFLSRSLGIWLRHQ